MPEAVVIIQPGAVVELRLPPHAFRDIPESSRRFTVGTDQYIVTEDTESE